MNQPTLPGSIEIKYDNLNIVCNLLSWSNFIQIQLLLSKISEFDYFATKDLTNQQNVIALCKFM